MPVGSAIKSKKQWRFLFSQKPEIADKMAHETDTKFKNLPTRVRPKGRDIHKEHDDHVCKGGKC